MAQLLATKDITDFNIFNSRAKITKLACVYESTGSYRYVVPFCELQAITTAYDPSAGEGRLRVMVTYTDNTTFDVEVSDTPADSIVGSISTTAKWYVVRGNGQWYAQNNAPSASATYNNSASPNLDEQLAVSVTKTLARITFYWTDN